VFGGGEIYNLQLFNILKELHIETVLFSYNDDFIKKSEGTGVTTKKVFWGSEPSSLRYLAQFFILMPYNYLVFFILLFKYRGSGNVVFFQGIHDKIIGTGIARILGYRVYWLEHLSLMPWIVRWDKRVIKYLYNKSSKKVDGVIAISQSVKKELISYLAINKEKVSVLYYGINLNLPNRNPSEKVEEFLKNNTGTVIGYVGRLHNEKGLSILIQAFNEVQKDLPSKLILVGEGEDRLKLEELVEEMGITDKVLFTGFQENVYSCIEKVDVFVLPSLVRESLGIVLLEAMSLKKICVASRIGGIPEIIQNGINGYLVGPGDVSELSRVLYSIHSLSKENTHAIQENAYATIIEKFSYQEMKKLVSKLLHI